jgi:hypothetical protein
MGGEAMIERGRRHRMQHGSRSGCNIAVDEYGNMRMAGSDNGASHGRNFPAAKPAQHFEGIRKIRSV